MSVGNKSPAARSGLKAFYSFRKPIFILLVLLFGGFGFLVACSSQPKHTQNETATEDSSLAEQKKDFAQTDTKAGWVTHTDTDNGFSIQYPFDWKVYKKSGLGYSFQSPDLSTGYGGAVESGIYVRFMLWREIADSIGPSASDDVLIGWFKKNFGNLEEGKLLSEPEVSKLAGYLLIQADRETFLFGKSIIAVVVAEDKSYVFDCFYSPKDETNARETFKGMLDTLQISQ